VSNASIAPKLCFKEKPMKIVKSFILTLALASAVFAGEMPQFDPTAPNSGDIPQWDQVAQPGPSPAASSAPINYIGAKILVAIIQNLAQLR
jgi:hypothetical protein